ncbi:MAG: ribulose-phosphate 3-epimerase [Candidatus Liptonbacteria bacterium]|nr:ribulose-phosphate 3-epimerase [Candidatus Liptonbacteria bacterium]
MEGMQVIPAINCLDGECVEEAVVAAKKFLPQDGWLHLDVADARFTYNRTWGDAEGWNKLGAGMNLEVHLMVEEPETLVPAWLHAGAKRVIVHVEAAANVGHIAALCKKAEAELMLASNPETSAEALRPYAGKVQSFQVLAVHPGLAGQKFLPLALQKVRFLKKEYPKAKVEVDGGINLETARLAKEAGVDSVAAATFIFGSESPAAAYAMLAGI